jgi:hypothetical protein
MENATWAKEKISNVFSGDQQQKVTTEDNK